MTKLFRTYICTFIVVLCLSLIGSAQTTEITYQGQLQNASAPANGSFDFEFALFDGGGSQIGPVLTRSGVAVANGIFSVNLDFGSSFPGASRLLEIRVRQSGGGSYTTLSPRQPLTSTPYSVKSLTSENSVNADNATNAITSTNFTGNLSGDVTGTQNSTTVARLQNRNVAATVPAGGQVLKFNSATNQWQPDTDNTGTGGGGGTITGVTPGTGLTGGGSTGNVTVGIANSGVGTAQLADNSVTDAKISSVSGAKVTGSVANATNATTAATATNALNLGGVAAGQYVLTGDARLTDARTPTAGSNNYIQNNATTTPQAGANFNISGDGTVGRNLTVNESGGSRNGLFVRGFDGGAAVRGDSSTGIGVDGFSQNGTGLLGTTGTGSGVVALGFNQGSIALRTSGTSWFQGNTTPFISVSGTGLVIGSDNNSDSGFIQAIRYNIGSHVAKTLTLNNLGGNVGIGTVAPQRTLHVNGRARIGSIPQEPSFAHVCFNQAGDLLQCDGSSLRWKTNVQPFRSGLNIIQRLKPITYNWKEGGQPDLGLGAEDVAKVDPSFTFTNDKGEITGVKYERLNMLLINAVKEQQKLIEDQHRINRSQQAGIETLQKANARLASRLLTVEKKLKKSSAHGRRGV